MLKKIYSGVLALILGLMAVGFYSAPANASETKKEQVCQATAEGHYNPQLVPRESIINGRGDNGINANDIVAPFEYNFDGGEEEHFLGQNWTTENKTLWKNGCKPSPVTLTPVLPVAPIATCTIPDPTLTIPAQPNGITVTSAADDKGNFSVSYDLPKNTAYHTYAFPEGFTNPVNISTIDNRPIDEFWDATDGVCKMPDTGAGSIKSEHLVVAAVLIFAGALLLRGNRRKA